MQRNEQIGRRLTLRDLHYLMTVAHAGSMAKAATLLSVSQPVISKIIADMEHALGVRLLDRSSRGVEPSIYGRRILAAGYVIFDELRQGVIEIEHLSDPASGELSIGCNEASTLGIVPAVIAKIQQEHPRFLIRVVIANTAAEQRRELSQRKIEFAIGRIWVAGSDQDFEAEVLFEQQFFVVAGTHNRWIRRSSVELAEIIGEPWVMPSLDSVSGQLATEVFRASGLEVPRSKVVTSSFQLNQCLLEGGPFLSLLPTSVLPSLMKNSSLGIVPAVLPQQSSPVGIVKLKNRRLSPVAKIFLDMARSMAKSMLSPDHTFAVEKLQ